MQRKVISMLMLTIIAGIAVNANAAAILDDKRAVFSKIDAGQTAELDSAVTALKAKYAKDANGLSWALVHIAQYLDEKGNGAKAIEIRQQVISQYPGTEQAEAAKIRIIQSEIFKLLDSRDYSMAYELINQLQTDYRNNSATPWALEGIANILQLQGRESKTAELRQIIIKNYPDSDIAKIAQIRLKTEQINGFIGDGGYSAAETAITQLRIEFSGSPDLPLMLNEISKKYRQVGNTDKANAIAQTIISDYPGFAEQVRQEQRLATAISDCEAKIQEIFKLMDKGEYALAEQKTNEFKQNCTMAKDFPWRLVEMADRFERAGQKKVAVAIYREVINNSLYPAAGGLAAAKLYDVPGSIQQGVKLAADSGIKQLKVDYADKPVLTSAMFFVMEEYCRKARYTANISEARNLFAKARDIWEQISDKLPKDLEGPDAYLMAIEIYFETGKYLEASAYAEKYLTDWPQERNNQYALLAMGESYQRLKQTKIVSASEADQKTRYAFSRLVNEYQNDTLAIYANKWLTSNK